MSKIFQKAGMAFLFVANLAVKLHNCLFLNYNNGWNRKRSICEVTWVEAWMRHDKRWYSCLWTDMSSWAWTLNNEASAMSLMSSCKFVIFCLYANHNFVGWYKYPNVRFREAEADMMSLTILAVTFYTEQRIRNCCFKGYKNLQDDKKVLMWTCGTFLWKYHLCQTIGNTDVIMEAGWHFRMIP